jgi:thymidylate synthase (FAD)
LRKAYGWIYAIAIGQHDMRIIKEPEVYLVGKQNIDNNELSRFLKDHDVDKWETDTDVAGQKLSEVAGRLCYMSFAKPRPGGNSVYTNHILEVGHGSVLEHAVWNFIISGVSRSFTHELIRHRAGFGFSQLSQRFVDESVADFIEPQCIASDPIAHEAWLSVINACQEGYQKLVTILSSKFANEQDKTLQRKLARQAARSVLPNATETKIFVTANARALRHFFELRGSVHAEVEIRKVAVLMLKIMQKEAPNIFADFEIFGQDENDPIIRTNYHKV